MIDRRNEAKSSFLPPEVFILAPDQFVDRCVEAFGLDRIVDDKSRADLIGQIKGGRSKLEVAEALRYRRYPNAKPLFNQIPTGLGAQFDSWVVVDQLERFSPDDDSQFITELYSRLLKRDPKEVERQESLFKLKTGQATRQDMISSVARRSDTAYLSETFLKDTPVSLKVRSGVALPSYLSVTTRGQREVVLMRDVPGLGLVHAPNSWLQPLTIESGVLRLTEGWVAAGPKRDLPACDWLLQVNIVQDADAEIVIDVVANLGLDLLTYVRLVGSAVFQQRLTIRPDHHFIEIRLLKPAQRESLCWLKVNDLSLSELTP